MTKTLISSDKQEVTIGFDAPFCVIGERINIWLTDLYDTCDDGVSAEQVACEEAGGSWGPTNAIGYFLYEQDVNEEDSETEAAAE